MNIAASYFVVPELAGALGAGAVVAPLPDGLVVVLPEVAPLAASFMHCSFSVPLSCSHLASLAPAAALPLAPVEVLDWPVVLPLPGVLDSFLSSLLVLAPAEPLPEVLDSFLSSLLVLAPAEPLLDALDSFLSSLLVLVLAPAPAEPLLEVDGVLCELVLPLPDALDSFLSSLLVLAPAPAEPLLEVDGVLCELVLPLAAPRSRRQRSFSAAIMLSQLLLAMPPAAVPAGPLVCAPVVPDEVWAKEALDSARSAAAVALANTLRFI